MDINELLTYNLSDAVKFNDQLNPRIWDSNEQMLPEVRESLLAIAQDFEEFLGISDVEVQDITISGSNAAYTYTDHSDIDLHLVADLPEADVSEVYRELFDAKKYQYNDLHDITIGGYDVELYVQNANEPHHSRGIYSVLNDKWISVPSRSKPDVDDESVRSKYQDLAARIEQALKNNTHDQLAFLIKKLKSMRQSGLEQTGEFGAENLAFKMLRTQGYIDRLTKARNAARDQQLSLDERRKKKSKKKPVRYAYGSYWYPGTAYAGQDQAAGTEGGESVNEDAQAQQQQIINRFAKSCTQLLKLKNLPKIQLHHDTEWSEQNGTFGRYTAKPHNTIELATAGRHIIDVLRTLAHEMTHARQNEITGLPDNAGETGSPFEDEANAMAGRIMRHWAVQEPEMFAGVELEENLSEASGYIPTKREQNDPRFKMALTPDVQPGATGKNANKLGLKTDSQGKPALLIKGLKNALREFKEAARMPQPSQGPGKYRDLNEPLGPETPPTMPAGTVRVDVSDMYDWYKLGTHIANMKGLGKHDFGAGPPASIISFGDEETEHKFIKDLKATGLDVTDIDPADPNQPRGMQQIKTDPTYNVDEAFDQPYKTKSEKSEYGDVDVLAKLPDGTNLSIMFNQEDAENDIWGVEFYRNNSQEVTGEGDAQRIFATVLNAIQKFIKKNKPQKLFFSASKVTDPTIYYEPGEPQPNPESRAKLYDRMIQRYARAWGYRAFRADTGTLVRYELSRLQSAVTESFQEELVESLLQELALVEDEYISEIKMTGKNLRTEAAKTGAQAGMEFEMIVPNTEVDVEPEYEVDMDQDRRARSFDDVRDFFHDGDYNSRRDVDNLIEELDGEYEDWQQFQTAESWARDGQDYVYDYVTANDLYDRDEAMGEARDEIIDANPDLPQESEEFSQLLSARLDEMERDFADQAFEDQGRVYNDAFETFAEEQRDEYDERSFLDDRYPTMSDIQSNFDITWPYYYDINDGQSGDMDVDQVADEFSSYMNKPVNASQRYHGARREAGHYVVEPDGSLEGDNPGDAGLEFVSPPMPIDEMIADLNKVKAWAGKTGCYTNDSTGLHINISVPNYSIDKLDYVKLAILMGDEYILDLFGRSGNTYAKSAMGKIKSALKQKPEAAAQIMDLMKQGLDGAATKAIHTGITDKYTSINTKNGYIEFRSPGGDWLDSNFANIENTLLRFTVALSAAINPEAYRKEYLTKLYKLLSEGMDKNDVDVIQLFSNYSAGELDKPALIRQVRQKQLARNVAKGKTTGKMWWDVSRPGYMSSIEVVANSKEEAIDVALQPGNYPDWASARNTLQAKPLRPYQEKPKKPTLDGRPSNPDGNYVIVNRQNQSVPVYRYMASDDYDALIVLRQWNSANPGQTWTFKKDAEQALGQPSAAPEQPAADNQGNWGLWMAYNNRFIRQPGQIDYNVIRRFPSQAAAMAFLERTREENPNMRTDVEVREIPADYQLISTPAGRPAEPVNRNTLMPTGPGPWEVFRISDGSSVAELGQTNRMGAEVEARGVIDQRGEAPELYGVRTRQSDVAQAGQFQEPDASRGDLTPRGPGPWEIYRLSDNSSVRNLTHTDRQMAGQEARMALGMRGEAPELYAVRTRQSDAAQGGVVDVAGEQPTAPRTLTTPGQAQQQWTGAWLVLDPNGRELHRFSGIGNVQADANRHAINWLRAHPGAMQAGVTVAPEMSE